MSKFQYTKIAEFAGHGGPSKATPAPGEKYTPTPTTKGRYVIASIDKFKSGRYPYWSGIKWGTPMRLMNGIVQINVSHSWVNLSSINSARIGVNESQITKEIEDYYSDLYSSQNGPRLPGKIPDKWIFNDFGHVTIQYFKDVNNNYQFDNKIDISMGDMVHTTPYDEASTFLKRPFDLEESHGCIHVRPDDMDKMIQSGFVKKSQIVEVYAYTAITYPLLFERTFGHAPYEFHFFPGCKMQSADLKSGSNVGTIIIYAVHQL